MPSQRLIGLLPTREIPRCFSQSSIRLHISILIAMCRSRRAATTRNAASLMRQDASQVGLKLPFGQFQRRISIGSSASASILTKNSSLAQMRRPLLFPRGRNRRRTNLSKIASRDAYQANNPRPHLQDASAHRIRPSVRLHEFSVHQRGWPGRGPSSPHKACSGQRPRRGPGRAGPYQDIPLDVRTGAFSLSQTIRRFYFRTTSTILMALGKFCARAGSRSFPKPPRKA